MFSLSDFPTTVAGMVKFGNSLGTELFEPWRHEYVDYEQLKRKLQAIISLSVSLKTVCLTSWTPCSSEGDTKCPLLGSCLPIGTSGEGPKINAALALETSCFCASTLAASSADDTLLLYPLKLSPNTLKHVGFLVLVALEPKTVERSVAVVIQVSIDTMAPSGGKCLLRDAVWSVTAAARGAESGHPQSPADHL